MESQGDQPIFEFRGAAKEIMKSMARAGVNKREKAQDGGEGNNLQERVTEKERKKGNTRKKGKWKKGSWQPTSATVMLRSQAASRSTWSEPMPAVRHSFSLGDLAMRSRVMSATNQTTKRKRNEKNNGGARRWCRANSFLTGRPEGLRDDYISILHLPLKH